MNGQKPYLSQSVIHTLEKKQQQLQCLCSLCILWRGSVCQHNECAMWEKKQMQQRSEGVEGYIQEGMDIFGEKEHNTLKSQLSLVWQCDTFQFLPNILCSHLRGWLSIYVCVLYLSEGEREFVWIGNMSVGNLFVYILVWVWVCVRACVCEGLCWPAWLRVNQSCWISVSQLPHLLHCSCKLLTVPGWLQRWGVK